MAEKMTTIRLPGTRWGCADWGHKTADEMIALIRSHADHLRKEVADLDAALDSQFHIYIHTGVHLQRNKEVIQEGRPND